LADFECFGNLFEIKIKINMCGIQTQNDGRILYWGALGDGDAGVVD